MIFREQREIIDIDEVGALSNSARAKVLIEALPWIEDITGKTIVIKYGGAAMVAGELRDAVVDDIIMLKLMGANPIIVHGGGPNINAMLKRLDMPVRFENGQRVTDEATMEVVKMTLVGQVNQELVSAINRHGSVAVGLNGADAKIIQAEPLDEKLGRVGKVKKVDTTLIEDLLAVDYIPVIATVGYSEDGDYNINADTAAGEIAAAIIELKEGESADEAEIEDYCAELPRYKRPRRIIFADVPRNPTGKIEKPKLRHIYCGDTALVERQTQE